MQDGGVDEDPFALPQRNIPIADPVIGAPFPDHHALQLSMPVPADGAVGKAKAVVEIVADGKLRSAV